jgi:hypothetical protein
MNWHSFLPKLRSSAGNATEPDLSAAKTVEEVEALLPWNLRIPDLSGHIAG